MAGLCPNHNQYLLKTGEYSDYTLVCKSREWKVHKAIVCAGSPFIKVFEKGQFGTEGSSRLELFKEDPDIVDAVIQWLYCKKYELPESLMSHRGVEANAEALKTKETNASKEQKNMKTLNDLLQVYACADRLGVMPLCKNIARSYLSIVDDILRFTNRPTQLAVELKAVCDHTSSSDTVLRQPLLRRFLTDYTSIDDAIRAIVETEEPLAFELATASHKASESAKLAKSELSKARSDLFEHEKDCKKQQEAADHYRTSIENFKDATELLGGLRCRRCSDISLKINSENIVGASGMMLTFYHTKCRECNYSYIFREDSSEVKVGSSTVRSIFLP